jgi:hypothetical protein
MINSTKQFSTVLRARPPIFAGAQALPKKFRSRLEADDRLEADSRGSERFRS